MLRNISASQQKIHPAGFEPATNGLEIRCSIQLSYGCLRPRGTLAKKITNAPVRPAGFEPAACGLGNRRSILLSYGRPCVNHYN